GDERRLTRARHLDRRATGKRCNPNRRSRRALALEGDTLAVWREGRLPKNLRGFAREVRGRDEPALPTAVAASKSNLGSAALICDEGVLIARWRPRGLLLVARRRQEWTQRCAIERHLDDVEVRILTGVGYAPAVRRHARCLFRAHASRQRCRATRCC